MASVFLVPAHLRPLAKDMSPELVRELSQRELNARLTEVQRIHDAAKPLPAELFRARLMKARQVRDALPRPAFQARLDGCHKSIDELPGTGIAARELRRGLFAAIVELKEQNPYPEGIEQILDARKGRSHG